VRIQGVILGIALGACAAGCDSGPHGRIDGKLAVAVSVPPQAWLVRAIGGEHVDVAVLVAGGQSPHTHQPTDAQISRVMASAVYFRIGVPFERGHWFEAVKHAGRMRIVDQRHGIVLREIEAHGHNEAPAAEPAHDHHGHDHHHGHEHDDGKDPHIWTAPRLLQTQAKTVLDALVSADPDRAPQYRSRHAELVQRLQEADSEIRAVLEPVQGHAFFIYHPSWGYFADEYGLKQIAIETGGKDPSDAELTALQKQARQAKARVVFVQPQIQGRGARVVAEAVGAELVRIDPLAPDVLENLKRVARAIAESRPPDAAP